MISLLKIDHTYGRKTLRTTFDDFFTVKTKRSDATLHLCPQSPTYNSYYSITITVYLTQSESIVIELFLQKSRSQFRSTNGYPTFSVDTLATKKQLDITFQQCSEEMN